jgi:hypothetical protein
MGIIPTGSGSCSYFLDEASISCSIASPTSDVKDFPPMSAVKMPFYSVLPTASSMICASLLRSKEYRNIIETLRIIAIGFAMFFPAIL